MEAVFTILIFVLGIVFMVRLFMDFGIIKERGKHIQKMIDGFYGYQKARIFDLVEEDPDMPGDYDSLNAVRPLRASWFFTSRNHILDQELYDKVAKYSEEFGSLDFSALSNKRYKDILSKYNLVGRSPLN